jgi:hypothetical protein
MYSVVTRSTAWSLRRTVSNTKIDSLLYREFVRDRTWSSFPGIR